MNAFLGLPVGAAAGSAQIDGHEGAATVAASCLRCGFFAAARTRATARILVLPLSFTCTSPDRAVSRLIGDGQGM